MGSSGPWGRLDPNSAHQLWSHWLFRIWPCGRYPPIREVEANAARWLRSGFGSVGQVRVTERVEHGLAATWIEAMIEGRPAHDPEYVASVRRGFRKFVDEGWGRLAQMKLEVRVLAGDLQDGKPREQVVVIPRIEV